MGSRNNSSFQPYYHLQKLSKALEFAVSEWLLMFLLFIDACFGYLITKFASYCRIQAPCLLCSRFDHVLAKQKTEINWDSICNHHKSEISSVVLRGVCEKCVLSFTTKNESNAETFRSLVGKRKSKSNPLLEDHNRDFLGSRICFCCNKQYVSKNSIDSDASESLFASGEHAKNEKNIFIDESNESLRFSDVGKNRIVHSPEIDYQKVGVKSDSETELLVSEVHLKSDSQFEVLDHATIATCDSEEPKCQNDENDADMSRMNERIPSSNIAETPVDTVLETSAPPRTTEVLKNPVTENEPITTPNGHQISNYLDLGDAYKLAIGSKGRQLSGKLLEKKSFQDSSKDLKLLLSNKSNDNLISPKLSFNSDELTGIHFLQKRTSLERNESNLSLDGSIVSEIDGESIVDRLKRQVEHDKKIMGVLYKELEEERNASAVATNQAMAMITRLQEEKATLYTEALQYLRMMEEQAEYNSEALQNANDVIEEKEKRIQDLEEICRKRFEDVRE